MNDAKLNIHNTSLTHHRYFTRSSTRNIHKNQQYLKPLDETKLNLVHTGCGDVKQNIEFINGLSTSVSSLVVLCKTNKMEPNEANDPPRGCSRACIIFLRILLSIGMLTILIVSLIDKNGMNDIKNDLDSLQTKLKNVDSKLDKVIKDMAQSAIDRESQIDKAMAKMLPIIKTNDAQRRQEAEKLMDRQPLKVDIMDMVKQSLDVYNADKTGLPDFALESAGGRIVSIKNTETYASGSPILSLFGIPVCSSTNSPRTIIQPSNLPGECWPIKGHTGAVVIQLLGDVHITGVSLEHIPVSLSPTGEIKTAPKDFSILGLNNSEDNEGTSLGTFTYNITQSPIQYFSIPKTPKSYKYIEFRIHTNHGNPEYTCIYRLRVHGVLSKP